MDSSDRQVVIVGAGGHGRVIADIARACGRSLAGFLDDNPAAGDRVTLLGGVDDGISRHLQTCDLLIAIGDGPLRRRLSEAVLNAGGRLATLVHPSAVIAPDVTIGTGSVVMAGAVINTGSRIGRFSVVNTGAIIDHDNLVEDNVHISPGCSLAGTVTCREDSFLGVGATIIPGVVIGAGAYVAGGSTVIGDVPPGVLVAGCPAQIKRRF